MYIIVRNGIPVPPPFLRHRHLDPACPCFLKPLYAPLYSVPLPIKVFWTVPPPSRKSLLP